MRRPWLLPFVPVYAAGLAAKNALYDRSWLPSSRLGWPVISVGSLSAGGAGKTPVAKMLARLLSERGVGVDVLSRGYGRASSAVVRVELVGDGRDAERFGDEPIELARARVQVYVGKERFEAGALAEKQGGEAQVSNPMIGALSPQRAKTARRGPRPPRQSWGTRVHLLDDGFQHRRLARDLDIVLLTRQDVEDHLLPAGNLREPLSALKRAQVVVLREEEAARLKGIAGQFGATVWVVRRRLVLPELRPLRPLVFCGIARPEGFFTMVAEAGCAAAGAVALADHHIYGEADWIRLADAARACGADGFLTTAKDAVKLTGAAMARLREVGRVAVSELEMELLDEDASLAAAMVIWSHGRETQSGS